MRNNHSKFLTDPVCVAHTRKWNSPFLAWAQLWKKKKSESTRQSNLQPLPRGQISLSVCQDDWLEKQTLKSYGALQLLCSHAPSLLLFWVSPHQPPGPGNTGWGPPLTSCSAGRSGVPTSWPLTGLSSGLTGSWEAARAVAKNRRLSESLHYSPGDTMRFFTN